MRWVICLVVGALWACGGSRARQEPSNPDGGQGSGSGDGGAAADCAGVMPGTLGSAFTFEVSTSPSILCSGGTGDGTGTLAARAAVSGQAMASWNVRDSRGASTGTFDAFVALPQSQGFVALTQTNGQRFLQFSDSNGGLGQPPVAPVAVDANTLIAPSWQGGAIALSTSPGALRVRRFAADLTEAANATIAGSYAVRAAAEDASGAVLALVGAGTAVQGLWIDLARSTATGPLAMGSATTVLARALVGGGVAIRLDGRWTSIVLPSGATPAPPWMAQDTDLFAVRAGNAYAVVGGTGSMSLVSRAGNLCGTLKFPAADLVVGLDGSVMGGTGPTGCTKVFWPALLK